METQRDLVMIVVQRLGLVTQQEAADAIGIDRSLISKIYHKYESDSVYRELFEWKKKDLLAFITPLMVEVRNRGGGSLE